MFGYRAPSEPLSPTSQDPSAQGDERSAAAGLLTSGDWQKPRRLYQLYRKLERGSYAKTSSCSACREARRKCDKQRPCSRCLAKGIADTCNDSTGPTQASTSGATTRKRSKEEAFDDEDLHHQPATRRATSDIGPSIRHVTQSLAASPGAIDFDFEGDEHHELLKSVLQGYLSAGLEAASGNMAGNRTASSASHSSTADVEELRALVDSSLEVPFVIVEVASGSIVGWNRCMEEMTGFPADLVGGNHFEIFMDALEDSSILQLCETWKGQIASGCSAVDVRRAELSLNLLSLRKGAPVFENLKWDARLFAILNGGRHTHTVISSSLLPSRVSDHICKKFCQKLKSALLGYEGAYKIDPSYNPRHVGMERDFEILAEEGTVSEHQDSVLGYVWSLALSVNKLLRQTTSNMFKTIMQRSTTHFEFGVREEDGLPICSIARSFAIPEFGKTVRSNICFQQPMNLELCPIIEYLPFGFNSVAAPVIRPNASDPGQPTAFVVVAFSRSSQSDKEEWTKLINSRCFGVKAEDPDVPARSPWQMSLRSRVQCSYYVNEHGQKTCLREMSWGRNSMDSKSVKSDQALVMSDEQ